MLIKNYYTLNLANKLLNFEYFEKNLKFKIKLLIKKNKNKKLIKKKIFLLIKKFFFKKKIFLIKLKSRLFLNNKNIKFNFKIKNFIFKQKNEQILSFKSLPEGFSEFFNLLKTNKLTKTPTKLINSIYCFICIKSSGINTFLTLTNSKGDVFTRFQEVFLKILKELEKKNQDLRLDN